MMCVPAYACFYLSGYDLLYPNLLLKISLGAECDSPGSVMLFAWEAEKEASKIQGQPGQFRPFQKEK